MNARVDGGNEARLFGKRVDNGFEGVTDGGFFVDFGLQVRKDGRVDVWGGSCHGYVCSRFKEKVRDSER